jgi:hypothetical protein
MGKLQAKSFTFRIPAELDEAFRQQVEERDRGRFLVGILRQALGLEKETSQKNMDLGLVARIDTLSHGLELLKTEQDIVTQSLAALKQLADQQDNILQRLTKLEESSLEQDSNEDVLQSKTNTSQEVERGSVSQSKTDSKTSDSSTQSSLPLEVETVGTLMTTRELLSILREEDPKKNWTSAMMPTYRSGNKIKSWNTVGECKFIYAKDEDRKVGGQGLAQHMWRVIYDSSKEV